METRTGFLSIASKTITVGSAALPGRGWPRPVARGLAAAVVLTAVVAACVAGVSWVGSYSVLLGGIASVLANALCAQRVFGPRRGRRGELPEAGSPSDEMGALLRAEAMKVIAAVAAVLLVAGVVSPVSPAGLLGGFAVAHLGFSAAALALTGDGGRPEGRRRQWSREAPGDES